MDITPEIRKEFKTDPDRESFLKFAGGDLELALQRFAVVYQKETEQRIHTLERKIGRLEGKIFENQIRAEWDRDESTRDHFHNYYGNYRRYRMSEIGKKSPVMNPSRKSEPEPTQPAQPSAERSASVSKLSEIQTQPAPKPIETQTQSKTEPSGKRDLPGVMVQFREQIESTPGPKVEIHFNPHTKSDWTKCCT